MDVNMDLKTWNLMHLMMKGNDVLQDMCFHSTFHASIVNSSGWRGSWWGLGANAPGTPSDSWTGEERPWWPWTWRRLDERDIFWGGNPWKAEAAGIQRFLEAPCVGLKIAKWLLGSMLFWMHHVCQWYPGILWHWSDWRFGNLSFNHEASQSFTVLNQLRHTSGA